MANVELHPDFRDFLKLLNAHKVRYLLVGGYAVAYHGYPRATGDMDIWISCDETNAANVAAAVSDFGMPEGEIAETLFLAKDTIVRMGMPPVRIEVLMDASGIDFEACYSRREIVELEGLSVNLLSLHDLRVNKKASGRYKDLEDLEHLPE